MISSTARSLVTKIALFTCFICSGVAVARPQHSVQATTAEIKTLLSLNGSDGVEAQLGKIMAEQVLAALRQTNPGFSPRADGVVTSVVETYVREQSAHDEVTDLLVPIYARYLTERDVEHLIKFYRTPLGRKLARVTPAISFDSSRLGQQWAQSIAPGLEAKLMEALKRKGLIQ